MIVVALHNAGGRATRALLQARYGADPFHYENLDYLEEPDGESEDTNGNGSSTNGNGSSTNGNGSSDSDNGTSVAFGGARIAGSGLIHL